MEHPELVAWRISNFAGLVGREHVIASTDCGFSQGAFVPRVHASIMWAKLRTLAEGAALATQQLWDEKRIERVVNKRIEMFAASDKDVGSPGVLAVMPCMPGAPIKASYPCLLVLWSKAMSSVMT